MVDDSSDLSGSGRIQVQGRERRHGLQRARGKDAVKAYYFDIYKETRDKTIVGEYTYQTFISSDN